MIFAGDFAQLAPTSGAALYGEKVLKTCDTNMSAHNQEAALGKILWHQITTVVILRENMRQTRLPRLTEPRFCNMSIITALNTHKDYLNDAGSVRFAEDTGQTLTEFYSIDKLSMHSQAWRVKRPRRKAKKIAAASKGISKSMQEDLWKAPPSSTSKNIARKLALCIGLPVMIRNNDATELCITKDQEATVVGWESSTGPFEQQVLETLFLKLVAPPKDVSVPGLPTNIIPMTRSGTQLTCNLTNDMTVNINHYSAQAKHGY
ncbi:hypothetical protein B0H10DRAFT_2167835 [Mycena sp. CBHHK59/15]|nr:hypothetical protein B0H10DRAFT_2167835 [Mycena sp. CBHHK59/15]